MIQPPPRRAPIAALALRLGLFCLAVAGAAACDRATPTAAPTPTTAAADAGKAVASLSPALTELVLALGAGDRLVAVSNFEPPRPATDPLPRVGDYRTADWERLSRLRPGVILTQYRPDKMPEGLADRAGRLGARVVNVDIDTLADVEAALRTIGGAIDVDPAPAVGRFAGELAAIRARVAGRPSVPVLVVIGESGLSAVGPGNFVDELIAIAGGENVLKTGPDYATLDRERLIELDPPTIVQLLPAASEQVRAESAGFWREKMGNLSAVKAGRVYTITDADALLPGTNSAGLARRLAEILHP